MGTPRNLHPSVIRAETRPIVVAAADACGLSYEAIMARCRKASLVEARFVAMLALRRRGFSYPHIALALGHQNHTTCLHGVREAERLEANDPGFAAAVHYCSTKGRQPCS